MNAPKDKKLNIQSGKAFSVSIDEKGLVATDGASRKYRKISSDLTTVLFAIEDVETFVFYDVPGYGVFADSEDYRFIQRKIQQRRKNAKTIL